MERDIQFKTVSEMESQRQRDTDRPRVRDREMNKQTQGWREISTGKRREGVKRGEMKGSK